MKLSIIGLGKLGGPMAAVMAHKGHHVVGVDKNPLVVTAIREGRPPANEPQLAEMIAANRARLTATHDYEEAILATDVTFIIVPTPLGSGGRFSMEHVLNAAVQIGRVLRNKQAWHLVVLSSTVMPGSVGGQLLPALEKYSGKKCGAGFGLCYNPEFIALGSVVRDMLNPDMILIGESDARSGAILEELYTGLCESRPRIQRMNFVNAELTKLAVNTFVTTKISYANMLAELCEKLSGADVDVVTGALGCDTRIGAKYLKGALGYGGPCFPVDNIALSTLARENGVPALLAEATDALNRHQAPRVAELLLSRLPQGGTVGVLGLAYKAHTEVIEESQGVAIAKVLAARGARVVVYDPAAMELTRRQLGDSIAYAASAAECAGQSDVLAITTPWPEFGKLAPSDLKPADMKKGAKPVIVDCWRVLPRAAFEDAAEYLTLGYGMSNPLVLVAERD